MKKQISILLVFVLLLGLAGCGSAEPSALDGKWIAMGAEVLGLQMPVEDLVGGEFYFEIQGQGKQTIHVDGDSETNTWSLEGNQFTLNMRGADPCVGTLKDNAIVFEDMLGTGATMIFAKEGTEACDPALYDNMDEFIDGLVEDLTGETEPEFHVLEFTDELVLGQWIATSCKLDEEPYSEDPAAVGCVSMDQVFSAEFRENHTVTVTVMNQTMEMGWSCQEGALVFDDPILQDNSSTFYWSDDVLEVNVLTEAGKLCTLCQKIG